MIHSSFDIDFLSLKHSSIASWTTTLGFSWFNNGRVVENFGHFIIGKSLFETGLAINFRICSFIGVMSFGIQGGATFDTIEAFFVPIVALGSNAFRIKNLQNEEETVFLKNK